MIAYLNARRQLMPGKRKGQWEWVDDVPPSDVDAEKALLGALVCDPDLVAKAREIVYPRHFHSDACGILYSCLLGLADAKVAVDAVTIKNGLRLMGDYDKVGGAAFVAEVVQSVPYAHHWRHYAGIVLRCYARRSLMNACLDMARDAHAGGKPISELCAWGSKMFTRMAEWLKKRSLD
jgi:replicative DNA helicase